MKIYKSYLYLLSAIALASNLASCTDDKLSADGDVNDPLLKVETDEYAIGFYLTLDNLGGNSTRATASDHLADLSGTKWENYINTDNLRVMFCDEYGRFLFETAGQAKALDQSSNENAHQWFVRIPTSELEQEIEIEGESLTVFERLKNYPFKIAVLANWPEKNANYARYELKAGEPLSHLSHFYLDDSYIDYDGEDAYGHIILDGDHVDKYGMEGEETNYQGGHYYMGVHTNWVTTNYYTKIRPEDEKVINEISVTNKTADEYLRDNYDPTQNKIKGASGQEYNEMWKLWNFGGKYNNSETNSKNENYNLKDHYYISTNEAVKKEWAERNESLWYNPNNPLIKSEGNTSAFNVDGLELIVTKTSENFKAVETPYGKGFQMPRLDKNTISDYTSGNAITDRYLHFQAEADGIVRITAGAHIYPSTASEPHNVYLGAHASRGKMAQTSSSNYQNTNKNARFIKNGEPEFILADKDNVKNPETDFFTEPKTYEFPISVTYFPTEVYINSLIENTSDFMVIYEIEYIKDEHLWQVERTGIEPSRENPIPMYGIQDFDPLGDYWEPGILFNLSAYNGFSTPGYNYRYISLLRSLAKVELLLPKSDFVKPTTVFLRTLNKSARCAPLDIFTPTDIIWDGLDVNNDPRKGIEVDNKLHKYHYPYTHLTGGVDSEIANIQKFGPTYEYENTFYKYKEDANGNKVLQYPDTYLHDFRITTSWYFGIWSYPIWDWGWNIDTGKSMPQPITSNNEVLSLYTGETNIPNPRVLNTKVDRCDYVHFTYKEDSQYWRYELYVPEKNICDADDPGELGDRPKLMHIEFRFPGNPDDNYDNNSAYRIYFTENGAIEKVARNEMDNWETDYNKRNIIDDLRKYWPVVRNHIYRFKLTGLNQGEVKFEVRNSANRTVDIPAFN